MRPRTPAHASCALACVLATCTGAAQTAPEVPARDPAVAVEVTRALPDLRYIALPVITFHSHNTDETLPVRLYRPDGTVDPATLQSLSHFLRDPATGLEAPVVPRTVQLIVRIAQHFQTQRVDVVSAFRSRRDAQGRFVRQEGYHGEGSAIDFTLPDVPMEEVAAYARSLVHVGVGWYPTTRFVHLDSRDHSYFWENHAGPGRSGWDRPLDRLDAASREHAWTPADDLPWDPPGSPAALQLHPGTAPDFRLRRRASVRQRHRAPSPGLQVFHGR